MARVSQKMRKSGVNRCVPCSRKRRQRPLTTISNSSSEKQERIWTALRKGAAAIPSRREWMDETLRAFTSTSVLETKCSSLWRSSPAKTGLASGAWRRRLSLSFRRSSNSRKKLYAYTLPRGERVNTRTKDLIDMVLLIRGETLDKDKIAAAVCHVPEARDTRCAQGT